MYEWAHTAAIDWQDTGLPFPQFHRSHIDHTRGDKSHTAIISADYQCSQHRSTRLLAVNVFSHYAIPHYHLVFPSYYYSAMQALWHLHWLFSLVACFTTHTRAAKLVSSTSTLYDWLNICSTMVSKWAVTCENMHTDQRIATRSRIGGTTPVTVIARATTLTAQ